MLFWGVFGGTILALIVYNIGLYTALRKRFFAFYALFAAMSLLFQLSINGLFYLFDFRLDTGLSFIYVLLAGVFSLLFAFSFFDRFSIEYSKFRLFAYLLIGLNIVWVVMSIVVYPSEPLLAKGALFLTIANFLLAFSIALIGVYRRYEGSFYFFAGQVFIFIAYFYQIAVRIGVLDTLYLSTYVVAVCSFFDILFLSVAISQ